MEETLKQTCLHSRHIALGAKMSPFGGFDMPIQYGSIIEEHNAVRSSAGVFDVSHMGEIFVEGPQACEFIEHIFTNVVKGMPVGDIVYGMMCYPDGGVVDDLLVYNMGADRYLLVVNASNIDKDWEWICSHREGYDCQVSNESDKWGQIAVQGPSAESVLVSCFGLSRASDLNFYTFTELEYKGERLILSRTGYTGEDGFEIYSTPEIIGWMWDELIAKGVQPCGLGCRDTLRFEAGLPLYGHELSESISPVMAGLSMFCKMGAKDFIGADSLAGQKAGGVARKLVGIELDDNAVPRGGYPVELEDGTEVGVVTTGYHSITMDRSICFALVDSACSQLGTRLWVHIRKRVFPGKVVKKRFYTPNYKK